MWVSTSVCGVARWTRSPSPVSVTAWTSWPRSRRVAATSRQAQAPRHAPPTRTKGGRFNEVGLLIRFGAPQRAPEQHRIAPSGSGPTDAQHCDVGYGIVVAPGGVRTMTPWPAGAPAPLGAAGSGPGTWSYHPWDLGRSVGNAVH